MRIARQLKDDCGARFIPIHGLHATFLTRLCAPIRTPTRPPSRAGHEGAGDGQRRRGLVALAVGGPVVIGHGSISPQQASCSYRNSRQRERGPLT